MNILNIAAYRFVTLDELPTLKIALKAKCTVLQLRGTILVSPEGINLMLSGPTENIHAFQRYLEQDARFRQLHYKKDFSQDYTFKKLMIKIKKEIISLGMPEINPEKTQAPYVKPHELKQWLDEKRDIVLIDTRNDYEADAGTFENAKVLPLKHFRDFPRAIQQLDPNLKQKTIVTFCTGGIRCEKAALVMQNMGFENVYQLEGGILDYFTACGNVHYQGGCFVFDERVSVKG